MTTATISETIPSVWIGCLARYNEGKLVGDWYPATQAIHVNTTDVHGTMDWRTHDELWCFDTEHIPVDYELDLPTASLWGDVLMSVSDSLRPALIAWVRSGSYIAQGDTDLPSVPAFEDAYRGQWDTIEDYAQHLVDETGILDGVPEQFARYFDYKMFTRDLQHEYMVLPAEGGGIHVFYAV